MAKRQKTFKIEGDVPAVFTEHWSTAQLQEARDEAENLEAQGYFARITKVTEPTEYGSHTFYIVWQRGKFGLRKRAAYAAMDRVFGKQRRVY